MIRGRKSDDMSVQVGNKAGDLSALKGKKCTSYNTDDLIRPPRVREFLMVSFGGRPYGL